jgi:hypothetical protein
VFSLPSAGLICPLCNVEEDSLHHLFFRCPFARVSWRSSHWPLDSLKWSNITLANWINGILSPFQSFGIPLVDTHLFQIYASVLCDMLWFAKNQALHKGILPNISKFAENIMSLSLDHFAAWNYMSQPVRDLWFAPKDNWYKVNFDFTSIELFSVQAAVCRNSHGTVVKSLYQFTPPIDDVYAEAQAALLVASLASSLKLDKFVLEGNSTNVISYLQQLSLGLDKLLVSLFSKLFSLIPPSSLWDARKVNKSENFCTCYVTHWAVARVIYGYIPTFFSPSPTPSLLPHL